MQYINRRRFLESTASLAVAGTGKLLFASGRAGSVVPHSPEVSVPPPPMVRLGNMGVELSQIGMGTGIFGGREWLDVAPPGASRDRISGLMRHAYSRGIRFFDLADLYGTHSCFRDAFRGTDRDKLTILTKLWWRYDGPNELTSIAERRRSAHATLERFRCELATDYLDIVLLHCVSGDGWDHQLEPYIDALAEAKAKNLVRAIGCSCHDLASLETASQSPWVDVILTRFSVCSGKAVLVDRSSCEIEAVLRVARLNGKAIIGAKHVYGERLASKFDDCHQYVQCGGLLDAATFDFQACGQIDDALAAIPKSVTLLPKSKSI